MERKKEELLHVQLFDTFCLSDGKTSLREEDIHSKMLLKLFSYIYTHKKKAVTTEELIDALWEEDENANPPGALKNLVYRLRMILKEKWPNHEFILTTRGSYRWNNDINALSDTEILQNYYHLGVEEENITLSKEYLQKAIEQYKGEFLPKLGRSAWVASEGTFYHSVYLSAVREMAKRLEILEEYVLLEEICNEAFKLDSLNEELHIWFIKALLHQNKISLAEEQYKKVVQLLYTNLGVSPSEELKNLYQGFLKRAQSLEENLPLIQEELGRSQREGAFFCEYGVFKEIYLLEKAKALRTDSSICLIVISVEPVWGVGRETKAFLNIINEGMEILQEVLIKTLRSADVVARDSFSRYILMLASIQEENIGRMIERIESNFNLSYKRKPRARLVYEIEKIKIEND